MNSYKKNRVRTLVLCILTLGVGYSCSASQTDSETELAAAARSVHDQGELTKMQRLHDTGKTLVGHGTTLFGLAGLFLITRNYIGGTDFFDCRPSQDFADAAVVAVGGIGGGLVGYGALMCHNAYQAVVKLGAKKSQ